MDLARLGGMVAQAQREQGISDYLLEHEIGAPNGKAFNAAQIGRLKRGERKLPVPPEVVWRLIRILHLDPIEAAEAAGVWPPGVTADMLRKLDLVAVPGGRLTVEYERTAGQWPTLAPAPDLDPDLIDRLRPRPLNVVPLIERRRRMRRRRTDRVAA